MTAQVRGLRPVDLLAGWIAPTVLGSLLHLFGVVRRVRARAAG